MICCNMIWYTHLYKMGMGSLSPTCYKLNSISAILLDEPDMQDTAREAETYSYGPPHMAVQKQDNQHEHTFSNYVRIRDAVQKTCLRWWTIGKSGERGSGISVLPARHDDDDCYFSTRMASSLNNQQKLIWYAFKQTSLNQYIKGNCIVGHFIEKIYKKTERKRLSVVKNYWLIGWLFCFMTHQPFMGHLTPE